MGERGARRSEAAAQTAERLVDAWSPLGAVRQKAMFGGFGIFADDVMFGIVDTSGQAYLRADEATQERFEEAGSQRHGRMPYWTIPEPVAADEDTLLAWAQQSLEVARSSRR